MLDEIDQKIISILLNDARTAHAHIAEQIKLSRSAVTDRVKKLEQTGIILGYTTVINKEQLQKNITAYISARYNGQTAGPDKKLLMDYAKHSEFLEIHSMSGDDCYLIKVKTEDVDSLNRIVTQLRNEPLSLSTKTTIVLERYFEKQGGIIQQN